MDKYAKLKEVLREICKDPDEVHPLLFQAVVKSVEKDSCTVDIGGLELSDVRLKAVADGKTEQVIMAIPAVGSRVLAGSLTGDYRDLAVLSLENFDTLILGGKGYGGMVKVEELVGRLNKIEKEINELKQAISAWKPVSMDGGGALLTALTKWLTVELTETKRDEIENVKIVHG